MTYPVMLILCALVVLTALTDDLLGSLVSLSVLGGS
ncbi:hypothetical protein Taci_1229 [Thermanaerovibrio acidaminovorans DSM 6589]|uniref:Uncharacterized protein n=1 Tax=Thermanaerovibrio acidaminovorans (strain ATCC 49978 / DSM 6589 / Su883) TaxID=525903 RepID=D1B620_THEAS|nr:hypothetical protein Taci_1229 [Thermanaerovibrio acidaminovorans DSM 6589]